MLSLPHNQNNISFRLQVVNNNVSGFRQLLAQASFLTCMDAFSALMLAAVPLALRKAK